MPDRSNCPADQRLRDFAQDGLLPFDAMDVEKHVLGCGHCARRLVDLPVLPGAPDILGYRVLKEVGRGRFGVVYKALRVDRPVRVIALKILGSVGEVEASRFHREIAVLRGLDSQGIVKCIDAGSSGGMQYFVMDFVDGVHLNEYVAAAGGHADASGQHDNDGSLAPIDRQRAVAAGLTVFQKVCRAVADAHQAGVIHRDLKPRNILVDNGGEPHILDFGICSVHRDNWGSDVHHTITQPGDVIGTLKYMSPEQAWGGAAGPVDRRSDIWALGVMLYEIVTGGQHPYSLMPARDKPLQEAVLERIRHQLPRLPRIDHLERGADLRLLLERTLCWDVRHRLDSAAALADDMGRYLAAEPIRTKALPLSVRARRVAVGAAIRSRWPFAACFVAGTTLLLWVLTFVMHVGWYERADIASYSGARKSGPAGEGGAIIVVGITDHTFAKLPADLLAATAPTETADVRSWRSIHGKLMHRLAAADPRAVVWDYYFRKSTKHDPQFVEGARVLADAGVPIVLAASDFADDGSPDVSASITKPLADCVRYGAILARDMVQRPGEFVVAIKRTKGAVVPSVALATWAAIRHPEAMLELDWPGRQESATAMYRTAPDAYLRPRDNLPFTAVFGATDDQWALREDDVIAVARLPLRPPAYWQANTLDYADLFTTTDDQLRELVAGRVVLVGDLREPRLFFAADRHTVRYGADVVENVPGCYLLADSIAGVCSRRFLALAFPLSATMLMSIIAIGMLGVAVPVRLAKHARVESLQPKGLIYVALATMVCGCVVALGCSTSLTVVMAAVAGFALGVPMMGSFAVEFTRNRHRIIERKDRCVQVETGQPLPARTLTINEPRRRPIPETG